MARWSSKIENSIVLAGKQKDRRDFLDAFFESETYIPRNEIEEREFEEFSLVMSSMSILIYVALADGVVNFKEKNQIIDDLVFQFNQHSSEQKKLAEFGNYEKEIIGNIYDKIILDYQENREDLVRVIEVIDMVYSNNLQKREYLVRLCYYCGYSDGLLKDVEREAIDKVVSLLKVGIRDSARIEQEVLSEINR